MTAIKCAMVLMMGASCATDPSTDSTQLAAGGVANSVCDPLMIDLSGNGIALSSAAAGVAFDLHGTGAAMTGWPTSPADDGFLAVDVNGDGRIAGTELFGGAWVKAPGDGGFGTLGAYDDDGNGAITANDAIFAQLVVWLDVNRDGVSQPGELHHLVDMGITSISVVADDETTTVDGNGNADLGSAPVTSASGKARVHAMIPAQGSVGGNGGHTNAIECDGGNPGGGGTPPPSSPPPTTKWRCTTTCFGGPTTHGADVQADLPSLPYSNNASAAQAFCGPGGTRNGNEWSFSATADGSPGGDVNVLRSSTEYFCGVTRDDYTMSFVGHDGATYDTRPYTNSVMVNGSYIQPWCEKKRASTVCSQF